MNNPKTLQSGPVAERMEQGNADFLKHEKAKLKKSVGVGGGGWGERCMALCIKASYTHCFTAYYD